MSEKPFISVISPIYGAEGIVAELVSQIVAALTVLTDKFEIILVEDHSPDHSWNEIIKEAESKKYVKGIRLSRNYGQHNAIAAGMELAKGDHVVLLDCDLQHNPAYISELYQLIKKGHDLVFTRFQKREHGFIKDLTAKVYYKFLRFISGYEIDPSIGSYSMLTRKVVDAFNSYNDYKKAYLWVLNWVGFKSTVLEIAHHKRFKGKSTYSPRKLLSLAVNVTLGNSNRPLYLSVYLGLLTSLGAFLGVFYIFYQHLVHGGGVLGWSSTIVIVMFFNGLILTSIGVTGIYIAKIFEQTKQRPRYIIAEKLNDNEIG